MRAVSGHVIEGLIDEAMSAYEACVVSLQAPAGHLQALSLSRALESNFRERWADLTRYASTSTDERFIRNLVKLGSILKALYGLIYAQIPQAAPTEEQVFTLTDAINATYAQAYAAYKTVMLHATPFFVALPREFVLSELSLLFGGISELYYTYLALQSLASPAEQALPGGEELE